MVRGFSSQLSIKRNTKLLIFHSSVKPPCAKCCTQPCLYPRVYPTFVRRAGRTAAASVTFFLCCPRDYYHRINPQGAQHEDLIGWIVLYYDEECCTCTGMDPLTFRYRSQKVVYCCSVGRDALNPADVFDSGFGSAGLRPKARGRNTA